MTSIWQRRCYSGGARGSDRIPLFADPRITRSFVIGFCLPGIFACGGMHVNIPPYLSERFPTEVRATAVAFCFRADASAPHSTASAMSSNSAAHKRSWVLSSGSTGRSRSSRQRFASSRYFFGVFMGSLTFVDSPLVDTTHLVPGSIAPCGGRNRSCRRNLSWIQLPRPSAAYWIPRRNRCCR